MKEKGFETLIYVAERLRGRGMDVRFVIAGKGPMLNQYRELVHARGMGGVVEFIGFISDDERNAWLTESDVVVFPSLYEPFGIVALEGMAAEKPNV